MSSCLFDCWLSLTFLSAKCWPFFLRRSPTRPVKMASVHESLYFNPMMTNGVVHANVFGIKDWVTPYKISVLALLYDMTASKITLPERRRLNKLILPLQQVGCIDLLIYWYSRAHRCVEAGVSQSFVSCGVIRVRIWLWASSWRLWRSAALRLHMLSNSGVLLQCETLWLYLITAWKLVAMTEVN